MSVKELKCPKCGAAVSRDKNVCSYCKAQYVIEERAVLFGEYEECNTYKELSVLEKKQGVSTRIADLLRACRVCHIKNCRFFNKREGEVADYSGTLLGIMKQRREKWETEHTSH